jgi:hypothetical protein
VWDNYLQVGVYVETPYILAIMWKNGDFKVNIIITYFYTKLSILPFLRQIFQYYQFLDTELSILNIIWCKVSKIAIF